MTYDPDTYWPERHRRQGDTYVARGGNPAVSAKQVAALAPFLRFLPEGRVLDFGCGPGRFRPHLEERGLEYEGVDLIPGLGTMEVSDVDPGSFQASLAIFVLQHIVDEARYVEAVDTIYEALAPDGVLLVVDAFQLESPDPHMKPRGAAAVLTQGFSFYRPLGHFDAHWIGSFTK